MILWWTTAVCKFIERNFKFVDFIILPLWLHYLGFVTYSHMMAVQQKLGLQYNHNGNPVPKNEYNSVWTSRLKGFRFYMTKCNKQIFFDILKNI